MVVFRVIFWCLLLGLVSFTVAVSACPSQEQKISCSLVAVDAKGERTQKDLSFSVYSSTFVCDGEPNRFFSTEVEFGAQYKAVLYANWTNIRMAFFRGADEHLLYPLADFQSPRVIDPTQRAQTLFTSFVEGGFAQMSCGVAR